MHIVLGQRFAPKVARLFLDVIEPKTPGTQKRKVGKPAKNILVTAVCAGCGHSNGHFLKQ